MDYGINYMLKEGKYNDLTNIYRLFSKSSNGAKIISEKITPYIKQRGEAIYQNKDLAKDPTSKHYSNIIIIRVHP